MKKRFRICSIALLWILASVARLTAQTPLPLYANLTPDPSGSPPLGIRAVFFIDGLDLAGLRGAPEMLEIALPSESFTATLIEFERFAGFDENDDPIPGEEQVFVWSGKGAGNDVILSVAGEFLTGGIDGTSGQFTIKKHQQTDALLRMAPEELPPDEEADPVPVRSGFTPMESPIPAVERVGTLRRKVSAPVGAAPPVLDIAVLFTPKAKEEIVDAYPFELAPLDSFSRYALGTVNTAFRNSSVDTRVRLAGFAEIDFLLEAVEIPPNGNSSMIYRDALRIDPMVMALRDQLEADVVAVVLRASMESNLVNGCGFAYTQRPGCGDNGPIPGCSVGKDYSKFSMFWVSHDCVFTGKYAFVHELGHADGLEHHEETGVPRDRASFPFAFGDSFGFTDPYGPSRTIMSQGVGTRRLVFSGPDVFYGGFPTGVAGLSDNAQVIRLLTPVMEGFRGSSSYIFLDGFERGDTLFWSDVVISTAARGDPP